MRKSGTTEMRGLVWIPSGVDEDGEDDHSVDRDDQGRVCEVLFRADGERSIGYRSIHLDRSAFGPHCLKELNLCGILGTPMVLELERGGDGRTEVLRFRRDTPMTTAQQLDRHPRGVELVSDLRGMMRMSVLDCRPDRPEGPAAHEVIQWSDDSVTLIEHRADENGGLTEARMLPPLAGLGQLVQPSASGGESWIEEQERLVNMGMIHLASTRMTGRISLEDESSRSGHLEALLMPSTLLANDFRAGLADRRSAPPRDGG